MATGAPARPRKRAAKKVTPPVVVDDTPDEEEDEDELELEELEEDEVEESKPKAKKSAQDEVAFGVKDLITYIQKKYPDIKVDPRGLRNLIRRMAKDGSGRVDREIVPGNRTRYDWGSAKNPEVIRIIKALRGGELEADKKEKLDALKARQAEKREAAQKLVKATTRKKARAKPVVQEVDDEDEELELEDEDDE